MTPEEKERLAVHIKEIAKILYKNTPPEKIETFEPTFRTLAVTSS